MCICMGTKNISIMDDAYELLVRRKNKNESFSDVIRREIGGKKVDIMQFAGAWNSISDKDADDMKKTITFFRAKANKELMRKLKRNDLS